MSELHAQKTEAAPRPEQPAQSSATPIVQRSAQAQASELLGARAAPFERHADAVADAVVQGRSAEGLLDSMAGSSAAPAVQFNKVRDEHDKRGKDAGGSGGGSKHASFTDHDGKPTIMSHDHGHLDDGNGNLDPSKREDPTWGDRWALMKWIAKLEAAELLRPDLVDGTAAYRHFLQGNGRKRDIKYQRFIDNDSSGAQVFKSILEDARFAAIEKHDQMAGANPAVGKSSFKLKTGSIAVGNDGRFPYPATENWQKAIGAHTIWMELDVTVITKEVPGKGPPNTCVAPELAREFEVKITTHVEDMYNFNPGAADIATGIPDSDNGRFEITGLGQEYLNYSTITRTIEFETDMAAAARGPDDAKNVDMDRKGRAGRTQGGRGRAAER